MKKIILFLLFLISIILNSQEQKFDTIIEKNLIIISDSFTINYIRNLCILEKKSKDITKKKHVSEFLIKKIEDFKEQRNRDVCFRRNKVDGMKIRIGTVKTIRQANKLKKEAMILFPYISTPEVKDIRPNYYVMIGDYFSYDAAKNHFIKVKKKYPKAVLVNWRVYCRKAIPHGK